MTDQPCCKNCFYWRPMDNRFNTFQFYEHQECRRHAPGVGSPKPPACWPQTLPHQWCGDHLWRDVK